MAEETRAEALRLLEEYKATLAKVRGESEEILERSRTTAEHAKAEIMAEAKAQSDRVLDEGARADRARHARRAARHQGPDRGAHGAGHREGRGQQPDGGRPAAPHRRGARRAQRREARRGGLRRERRTGRSGLRPGAVRRRQGGRRRRAGAPRAGRVRRRPSRRRASLRDVLADPQIDTAAKAPRARRAHARRPAAAWPTRCSSCSSAAASPPCRSCSTAYDALAIVEEGVVEVEVVSAVELAARDREEDRRPCRGGHRAPGRADPARRPLHPRRPRPAHRRRHRRRQRASTDPPAAPPAGYRRSER